jgi:ribulose-5-phosphate 4-epimerase/fuculose-1-phosphate aldolase
MIQADALLASAAAPTQRTPEEVRLRRKRQLAATMRLFADYGFDEGAGGHVTARDPELPDCFWVNPFGLHFGAVRTSDLILVDASGAVVAGEGRVNPAALAIHAQLHAARPDVVAAAHTHSVHGRAFSTLRRPLDPLTQDSCAFFEDHAVFEDYTGVVLSVEEGRRIAAALGDRKALILSNHGLLTVGGSVEEAAWWFIALERSCQVELLAEAAGRPVRIDDESARRTRAEIGSVDIAKLNFRVLYAEVVRRQPDLLD